MINEKFRREFYRETAEHIKRTGRSILGVFGGENGEYPFSYTIGNSLKGLPELLVVGTSKGGCLNDLSEMMIAAGKPFEDGELVLIKGARLPMKLVRASHVAKDEYTIQAGEYFGHDDYEVMQAIMCDLDGKYTGEAGCKPPFSKMPVLREQ